MNRGAEQTLGVLTIEATFDDVYRRLFETAIVILIGQGAQTFVVSFFAFFIVVVDQTIAIGIDAEISTAFKYSRLLCRV